MKSIDPDRPGLFKDVCNLRASLDFVAASDRCVKLDGFAGVEAAVHLHGKVAWERSGSVDPREVVRNALEIRVLGVGELGEGFAAGRGEADQGVFGDVEFDLVEDETRKFFFELCCCGHSEFRGAREWGRRASGILASLSNG